jgi:hypothetical protein
VPTKHGLLGLIRATGGRFGLVCGCNQSINFNTKIYCIRRKRLGTVKAFCHYLKTSLCGPKSMVSYKTSIKIFSRKTSNGC